MTASTDKLLKQLEQLRKAGRGERIKVKMPRLRKSQRSAGPYFPAASEAMLEIRECYRAAHALGVSKISDRADVTSFGSDGRAYTYNELNVVRCDRCRREWAVTEAEANTLIAALVNAFGLTSTGRTRNTPDLQNLP